MCDRVNMEKRICKNCGKEIESKDGVWYHLTGYKSCNTDVAQPEPEKCPVKLVFGYDNSLIPLSPSYVFVKEFNIRCILNEHHEGKHVFRNYSETYANKNVIQLECD